VSSMSSLDTTVRAYLGAYSVHATCAARVVAQASAISVSMDDQAVGLTSLQ